MPLIVFEGIDGAGTTTHSKLLCELFEKMGRPVVWTSEPTSGPIGVLVREMFEGKHGDLPNWRTMLTLFQADREMHYEQIAVWLGEGKFVISDRSWLSGLAYQVTSAQEDEGAGDVAEDLLQRLNVHAPTDITLILDVPVDEALKRLNKSPDHYEKKEFLEKVRGRYQAVRGMRVSRISTEGKSIDETFEEVDKRIREFGY